MRYTHGYGAVVTPAAQDADKPLVWYLRDLNMYSDVGFSVKNPDIYYGEGQYGYAIVPNKSQRRGTLRVLILASRKVTPVKVAYPFHPFSEKLYLPFI